MTSLPPADPPASESTTRFLASVGPEVTRLNETIVDLEAERDALRALLGVVAEALDIPPAATADEDAKRAEILRQRLLHTVVALRAIEVHRDIDWNADYLRQRLAEHPATGYATARPLPRREQLLTAIREQSGDVTTAVAAQLNEAAGFSANRNTSRKDLRALARRGDLVRYEVHGYHAYTLPSGPDCGA